MSAASLDGNNMNLMRGVIFALAVLACPFSALASGMDVGAGAPVTLNNLGLAGAGVSLTSPTYGARCDGIEHGDGVISSTVNPTRFTSASTTFTAADIGKYHSVLGAGVAGAPLVGTIVSVFSTNAVILSVAASTTVASGGVWAYGTDDTSAIAAAITAAQVNTPTAAATTSSPVGKLIVPAMCITGSQTITGQISFLGNGAGVSTLALKAGSATPLFTVQTTGSNFTGAGNPFGQVTASYLRMQGLGRRTDPAGLTTAHGIALRAGTWYVAINLDNVTMYGFAGNALDGLSCNGYVQSKSSQYYQNDQGWVINSCSDWMSFGDIIGVNNTDGVMISGGGNHYFAQTNIFSNGRRGLHTFGSSNSNVFVSGSIDRNGENGAFFGAFTGSPTHFVGTNFYGNSASFPSSNFADIQLDATSTGNIKLSSPNFFTAYAAGKYNINFVGGSTSVASINSTPYIAAGGLTSAQFTNAGSQIKGVDLAGTLTTGGALSIANLATANQLLYATSANNAGGLATANSGVLITSGAGVPSISSTLPSAVQANITALGTLTGALAMTVGQSITWGGNLGIGSFSSSTLVRPTNATATNGVAVQRFAGTNALACLNNGLCTIGDPVATPSHLATAQLTAPALTSCGTGSPAIVGTDTAGVVMLGTTATGCVITFNAAYVSAPHCTVTWQATPLLSQSYTVSNAAITLVQTSASGNLINYNCIGRSGG